MKCEMTQRIFLNPRRKLVDEVVDWLCGSDAYPSHVRDDNGARSLAHLMVVVPTAQSGRNLRLALARAAAARGWGGVLPPLVVMPSQVLRTDDVRVATEAEELAVMATVLLAADLADWPALFPKPPRERTSDWALETAGTLLGILDILGERAMLMREVKCADDPERWRDLADVEARFLARLEECDVLPRCVSRRKAVETGCTEEGVEEIVLPSAVDIPGALETYLENSAQRVDVLVHADAGDADRFDAWGRPTDWFKAALPTDMIRPAPTAIVEADEIAAEFKAIPPDRALPALALCDAEMCPELEGAFQNHFADDELALRNPAKAALAHSALGRILAAVFELAQSEDYGTFSTFVRSGDVARWAAATLGLTPGEVAAAVGALDAVQNEHLPRTIDEAVSGAVARTTTARHEDERAAAGKLVRLANAVKRELADPYGFLRKIFASLTLDERSPADRELIAAAEVVRDLRADCGSDLVPEGMRRALFARLLRTASYSLEPDAANVLAVAGWLEIPWCAEDELVIAGFNDGCVPENVVGHAFVPNALRAELGLTTNDRRAMRDSFIFAQAVKCRAEGMVAVHLHQVASDKNVLKPSRILFLGIGDDELTQTALRLYAVTKGSRGAPPKELPAAWRLALPVPPAGKAYRKKISVTRLDNYRRCPFLFYLQEVFGEHADDRNQELDALTFGNLCHGALDDFAKSPVADATDAEAIGAFLEGRVHARLRAFGETLPAVIELQGEAAAARLRAFAPLQAERRKAGWRIVAAERDFTCTIKGCPTLLSGKVDRIDENERTGELAVIDYKTWPRGDDSRRDSLQLPAYRAMVEASGLYEPAKAHAAKAFYCVLADRAEDTGFDEAHACHEGAQSAAEDEIVAHLENLARGIFYPPGRNSNWAEVYGDLIWESPATGVAAAWLDDQRARLEAAAKEVAK